MARTRAIDAGSCDSSRMHFKLHLDAAAAQLKDDLCWSFGLEGNAARTLGVAASHFSVRDHFRRHAPQTWREIGYISRASDAFRYLWSSHLDPSLAVQQIVRDRLAALQVNSSGAETAADLAPSFVWNRDAPVFRFLGICSQLDGFYSGASRYTAEQLEEINSAVLHFIDFPEVLETQFLFSGDSPAASPRAADDGAVRHAPSGKLRARERRKRACRGRKTPVSGDECGHSEVSSC